MAEIQIATDEQILSVLFDKQGLTLYPGGLPVAANQRAIRQGDPIAIDTSIDHAVVSKYSQIAATVATAATTATLDDAHPFEVGDVVVFDDAVALTETVTITAINYSTNVITFTPAIIDAGGFAIDEHVSVITNNVDEPIGIALLPLRDKDAAVLGLLVNDVTPKERTTFYGSIALTGRFRNAVLKNVAGTGNRNEADLGGVLLAAPDIYWIEAAGATNLAL